MKAARMILSVGLFAVLCALTLAFVTMRVSGLATYIVTGGSMEPTIAKGSLILVEGVLPSAVEVGDVITFQKYDQTTSHRVIAIAQTPAGRAFTTKGDANSVADPEPSLFPGRVGLVRMSVPVAGYVLFGVQAYWRLALGLVAAVLFFVFAGALVFQREPATPATLPAARRVRRLTAAVIPAIDADAAWRAHLEWVERSRRPRLRVA